MVRKNLPLLSSFLRFDRKFSELGPPLITKAQPAPAEVLLGSSDANAIINIIAFLHMLLYIQI